MVDPVIGATVQVLLEKLLSLTIEKVSSSRDCNKHLRMITQNVSIIQAFIHDAQRRQVDDDQAVEKWLMTLERVAEDAENVLDEFTYEYLEAQVSGFFSHPAFISKTSGKIKNINEELRAINQLAKDLGLQSLIVPSQANSTDDSRNRFLSSCFGVVGRDNDVAEIKEKMLNMREEVVLCAIPIVGMGGLGKTTIAKRIINDEEIEKHFEKRVWLCLPEMSDTKSFLEQILQSLTQRKLDVQTRDIIVKKLLDELGGKRYLLVLDDLWRLDLPVWDEFMDSLRRVNTYKGNCILVTTRMKPVASTVAAVGPHMLEKLAKDHCWSMFKQRAFVDGEVSEEIVSVKNRIVEMCQGLPLAASVLGGLLRIKEKHEWWAILDGNPLIAGEDDNGENSLKKILKLSYVYLPSPYLKKYFAYFAMFPKDFMFEKDQLFQLCMAKGFLHPYQETTVMEDVGHKFFQLLLQNSLLQDVELDEHNNITYCKMHDLVHDLAGDVLKSKLFDPNGNDGDKLSQVRYFGWVSPSDKMDMLNKPRRLCTLFWKRNIYDDMLLSFQFLRVLNFSGSGIEELSAKISKLIYLRYLDLSDTEIRALPNSICKLYNLQTLRVKHCLFLWKFPEEMANMISLRHIYCNCHSLLDIHMPLNIGQLTSLQTIPFFYIGLKKGRRIEELGRLKNLRGELTIRHLQLVRNKEEAQTAYLQEKPNIYRLAYLWSRNKSEGCEINHEHVLDGLQPHYNLKTLEVENYFGTIFPSWFSEGLLPNLVKLKLSGCKRCKEIPSLGQLKFLRHLELIRFLELKCIGPTFYGVEINDNRSSSNNGNIHVFPSLKELVLENMCSLIEWKGDEVGVRMFPRLEKLTITDCPLLKSTPTQFEIMCELKIKSVDSEMTLLNLWSNLTSLVYLRVNDVKELTCIPNEMLRNNVSLQFLSVSKCGEFRELPQSFGENYFSSLEVLCIKRCENLVSLPLHMGEMPSLSYLDISKCPKLISLPSGGLHHLTGLTDLGIGPFSEMVDFEAFQLIFNGIQQLLSLRRLNLWGHLHWDSLPYQLMQLSSLTGIHIYDFKIEALPHRFGNLTSLESLGLTRCKRLRHVDFSDAMPKLRYLSMNDCPLLEALSDGLGNLASLEDVTLQNCEKLERLPSRDSMRRLTNLGYLHIYGCPRLEESCTNRSGRNSQ
ncbi:hypothetical protein H5410_050166 [Solanum commersonii]|uniref:Cc-nbs-lrr resistance protein n=1 Tax=Solanum commersonii TaxID=4109 RepID=A0A9J5WUL3_SOLCO|nr:hypothetical protein H5410_050166 [Solanum commersonii]